MLFFSCRTALKALCESVADRRASFTRSVVHFECVIFVLACSLFALAALADVNKIPPHRARRASSSRPRRTVSELLFRRYDLTRTASVCHRRGRRS